MNPKALVSVVMITYAHEKYIREAVNGVLMQSCDFDVELVIVNDCSPDQTDIIVHDIMNHHPNGKWIKYIKHETNIGMMPNFIFALNQAKGKYIALCEGDDYWTDPYKLQKQVDFLEKNPDYNICGHSVACTKYNQFLEKKLLLKQDTVYSLKEVVQSNPIHTSSFCFINNFDFNDKIYLDSILDMEIGDYPLLVLFAQSNGVFVFKDVMSVYRIDNQESVWTGQLNLDNQKKMMERTIRTMTVSPFYNKVAKKYLKEKLKNKNPSYLRKAVLKIYKTLKILLRN